MPRVSRSYITLWRSKLPFSSVTTILTFSNFWITKTIVLSVTILIYKLFALFFAILTFWHPISFNSFSQYFVIDSWLLSSARIFSR